MNRLKVLYALKLLDSALIALKAVRRQEIESLEKIPKPFRDSAKFELNRLFIGSTGRAIGSILVAQNQMRAALGVSHEKDVPEGK